MMIKNDRKLFFRLPLLRFFKKLLKLILKFQQRHNKPSRKVSVLKV